MLQHNKRREELHRLQEKHPELAARLARKVGAAIALAGAAGASCRLAVTSLRARRRCCCRTRSRPNRQPQRPFALPGQQQEAVAMTLRRTRTRRAAQMMKMMTRSWMLWMTPTRCDTDSRDCLPALLSVVQRHCP